MTVLFRPLGLNMTISPDTRGQIFPVKILDAAEGTAIVSVNGKIMNVKTEIPLTRHQIFIVVEEKPGDGSITWRILTEVSAGALGKIGASLRDSGTAVKPEIDLVHALRWSGVPLTESNLARAGHILELLGEPSPGNILAAAISTKLGINTLGLIQAIAVFASSLFYGKEVRNELNSKDQIVSGLRRCCEGLQRLIQFVREHPECTFGEALKECFPGYEELGKLLVGGQLFIQAQETAVGSVFYYIPLFLYLPIEGEAYLFPPQQGDKKQLRFLLLVKTERLGRIKINMKWGQGVLGLQTFVEKHETKELLDKYWTELAARLENKGFCVQWSGCQVDPSSVKPLLMRKTPRSFDLLI